VIRRRFISILVLLGLFAFNANADSLGKYLKEKVAGDVISVTEWNALVAGLIDGVSDINVDHQVADFCFSASDTNNFVTGMVIPIFFPPAGSAITIEQIVVGTIGGGTVALGMEERVMTDMANSLGTVIGYTVIDGVMDTIESASLTDNTLAANRVLCATFPAVSVTGTVTQLFGRVYYNRLLTN